VREKQKECFLFSDSSLVGCGTVSTCKSDFPKGNISYIFRNEQWKDKGIYFKILVNFAILIKA